ncbi:MAG: HEAT repeat domain-containing protein, partial [Candidatus Heimdallarchaeota archaeon]|nr:HEAT repeat domain-containing protein [Candidatus Heimdallarchaeota archaeon]
MSEISDLLNMADSDNKKDRQKAAKGLGKLDKQYESVMDKLRNLTSDDDKKVRQEAEKSLNKLGSKPTEEGGDEVEVDDASELEVGEYDVDSSLSDRAEDRAERSAQGKGLQVWLKEKNSVVMDYYGNKQSQEMSNGSITVGNTGSTNRITGVDLFLGNIESIESETPLSEKVSVGSLSPGRDNDWKTNYSFQSEITPIKVEQVYADDVTGLSPNFVGGEETQFTNTITITNTSGETISNVKGVKQINTVAELKNSEISTGEIRSTTNEVSFNIEEIAAGDSVEIKLSLTGSLPEDVPSYKSGDLTVSYENKEKLISGLTYENVDGVSDIYQHVKKKQRETEPGFYDCEIIFENESEFVYDLNKFTVFAGSLESSQIVLDWDGTEATEDEREIVPGESVNYTFVFESVDGAPSFGEHVEFSVQTMVSQVTETTITLPEEELKFMAIAITKSFMSDGESVNRYELPSYVETEVPTVLRLTGVGSYPIEALTISDEVPAGFKAPVEDQVVVSRAGTELSADQYTVTITESEEGIRLVNVTLEHLEETAAGGLQENEEIEVRYVNIAENPEPSDEPIKSQAHAEGYIYLAPDAKIRASSPIEELELIIVHVQDDLDIGKRIQAIEHDGQDAFRITLQAENNGSSTVEF